MTEYEYHNAGNSEAQQKEALAYLLSQSTTGKAATGVLSGLAVTQTGTASGSILIAAGAGVAQAAVLDGASVLVNDTSKTLDIFTANPVGGLPRNDVVVFDAATVSIRALVGVASATPSDPTIPTSAIPLARLRHAASAATITTAKIDDLRTFTTIFGVQSAGAWQAQTVTAGSGWSALAGLEPEARLLPNGDVEIAGAVLAGASISNNVVLTLPVGMRPPKTRYLPAHHTSGSASGKTYQPYVTSLGELKIDATYADGGSLAASVAYPVSGVIPL